MKHIARVKGICRDRPRRVEAIDGRNKGALAKACARARSIERGERAVRSAQEAVKHIAGVKIEPRDRPSGLILLARVPWPKPMPAPGTSKVVMAPSGARRKPSLTSLASPYFPAIAPAGLMLWARVPWSGPVPAPGASKFVIVSSEVRGKPLIAWLASPVVSRDRARRADGDRKGALRAPGAWKCDSGWLVASLEACYRNRGRHCSCRQLAAALTRRAAPTLMNMLRRFFVFHKLNFVSLFWPSVISHRENSFPAIHRCTAGNPERGYAENLRAALIRYAVNTQRRAISQEAQVRRLCYTLCFLCQLLFESFPG